MLGRQLVIEELLRVEDVLGFTITERRVELYYEEFKRAGLNDFAFKKAVDIVISSWEQARFPPPGAFINRAKEFLNQGLQTNGSSNGKPKSPPDPKILEALNRHDEYLKMSSSEYMKVMMAASKHWNSH